MIVYGQTNLLKAAQEAGVKKFIPSTFSLNMFNIPEGEHPFLDSRLKFAAILEKSGMPHVHVLNGGWLSALCRCCYPGVVRHVRMRSAACAPTESVLPLHLLHSCELKEAASC